MKRSVCISVIAILVLSCQYIGSLPEAPSYDSTIISGIPGPEDFAVFRGAEGREMIVVSSDQRLESDGVGAIYLLNPESGSFTQMNRTGEPKSMSFHPHGIDIHQTGDGTLGDQPLLYVINHPKQNSEVEHAVLLYRISGNVLIFMESLESHLLVSPNDLFIAESGILYVTNDSSGSGGFAETALKLKRSSVVSYATGEGWRVVADRIAMANGIFVNGHTAYVAATRQNAIFAFTIDSNGLFTERRRLAKIKGPDNIMLWEGKLLVAAHTKTLALVRHMSNQRNPSPSVIYSVDPQSGDTATVFADDGTIISAASTAAFVDGTLFIGQIVAPHMVSAKNLD